VATKNHNSLFFNEERKLALRWTILWHTGDARKKQKTKNTFKNSFMKKLIIAALLLTIATTYSFAGSTTNNNSGEVKTSFRQDFKNAQLMSTEANNNFTKITFKMNDQVLCAFYSTTGELLAVTRNILSSQLPINLMMSLKKHYGEHWITDLFELNGNDQTAYYVSLENADSKMTLRSNGDKWELYASAKK